MEKIFFLIFGLMSISLSLEIKGINFVSVPYSKSSYSSMKAKESIAHLNSTGANWVSIPIAIFQDDINASEMRLLTEMVSTMDRQNLSPTEKEINDAVTLAKNSGLQVMLMPKMEFNFPGFWSTALIGDTMAPYEVRRWFEHYQKIVITIAKWGEVNGADMLCIGHNLNNLAVFQKYWDELIKEVKKVYSGKLTYSASTNTEYLKSGFWKDLFPIQIGRKHRAASSRKAY